MSANSTELNHSTSHRSAGDVDVARHSAAPVRGQHARMTTESQQSRDRRRALARRNPVPVSSPAMDRQEEVLEISSDDDLLGSGPPWDIRPDDTLYRGRSVRSAVGSVQAARDRSPFQTRSTSRRNGVGDGRSRSRSPIPGALSNATRRSPSPSRVRPRPKPMKRKSAAIVPSSDDEHQASPARPSESALRGSAEESKINTRKLVDGESPAKKVRLGSPMSAMKAYLSSDDDTDVLPSVSSLFAKSTERTSDPYDDGAVSPSDAYLTRLRKRRSSPVPFIDDEAMEEDDDGQSVKSDQQDQNEGDDEYDLSDPFIDDSDVHDRKRSQRNGPALRSPFEDDLRTSSSSRQRDPIAVLPRGATNPDIHRHHKREDVLDSARGSDRVDKGKGKATERHRSPTPVPAREIDGSVTDEEEAARRSLLSSSVRVGESSRHGSSSTGGTHSVDDQVVASHAKSGRDDRRSPRAERAPANRPTAPAAPRKRVTMADLGHRHASASRRSGASTASRPPSPPVTLEELTLERRCTQMVDVDEVLDRNLMDEFLIDSYVGLPRYRRGRIIGWSTASGIGLVRFSAWIDQCPNMDGHLALDAVQFRGKGNIRNPSRTDPTEIALKPAPMTTNRYNMYIYGPPATPMLAFSTGFVELSQLVSPSDTGLRQRFIRLIFHSQEFELFEGFLREVTDLPAIHAQFARDALQISTRAQASSSASDGGQGQSSSPQTRGLKVSPQKMFKARSSASGNRVLADNFSLPNDVIVPVYDARNADSFDVNRDIDRLGDVLPLFGEGEVPYGSFAGVGYTMTVYRSSAGNWTVGCNIQWVIVFGTPHDE